MEGGISSHLDRSGAARTFLGSPYWSVPADLPNLHDAASDDEAIGLVKEESTEAEDLSETVSVGGTLSNRLGCESVGVTFKDAIGRAGLISETDTVLDTTSLPLS